MSEWVHQSLIITLSSHGHGPDVSSDKCLLFLPPFISHHPLHPQIKRVRVTLARVQSSVPCLSLSLSASPTKWSARLVSCCRVAWSSSPISWLQEAPAKVGAGHWPWECGSRVMWPHVYTEHWPVLGARGGGGVIWHKMRRRLSVNIRSTSTVKNIRSNYKCSPH